jgi:hypothetical protein
MSESIVINPLEQKIAEVKDMLPKPTDFVLSQTHTTVPFLLNSRRLNSEQIERYNQPSPTFESSLKGVLGWAAGHLATFKGRLDQRFFAYIADTDIRIRGKGVEDNKFLGVYGKLLKERGDDVTENMIRDASLSIYDLFNEIENRARPEGYDLREPTSVEIAFHDSSLGSICNKIRMEFFSQEVSLQDRIHVHQRLVELELSLRFNQTKSHNTSGFADILHDITPQEIEKIMTISDADRTFVQEMIVRLVK